MRHSVALAASLTSIQQKQKPAKDDGLGEKNSPSCFERVPIAHLHATS